MSDSSVGEPSEPKNLVGKRYTCTVCGLIVMCAKGGDGHFACHDVPMSLDDSKPLPSTD